MKRTRQLTPLGIKIKMALAQKNMTSKELAQRIGRSEATISEVLCGRNKKEETRKRIMKELGLEDMA